MPTARNKARKPGCTPCRERHLRCDRAQPSCSSCSRARYPLRCEYQPAALKYRPSIYSTGGHSASGANQQQPSRRSRHFSVSSPRNYESAEDFLACGVEASKPREEYPLCCWDGGNPPTSVGASQTDSTLAVLDEQHSPSDIALLQPFSTLVTRTPGSAETSRVPRECRRIVTDSLEARLFDFFVKNAGPWLDIVSPSRYFGETVPRMALTDSTLYYACLAYSARVLTLMGELDRTKGDLYQDRAIAQLIPRLSEERPDPSADETLPATAVILRMAEQFSEIGDDARCHLLGASSIFARTATADHHPDASNSSSSDAAAAPLWVYMRQSIRVSFLNEEACRFGAGTALLHIDCTPAPDEAWANRMTYLLARACSACWDATLPADLRLGLLEKLRASLELWRENVPDTFRPWCEYWTENDPFPVIRYICPWHVIGWQYYYAAKVLIGIHKKPREMDMFDMTRYMETEVLAPAHLLCAITFACDNVGASINGTHLVSWCGQLLSVKKEQERVIEFLQEFMGRTKWPNQTCCDRLQRIWTERSKSWVDSG